MAKRFVLELHLRFVVRPYPKATESRIQSKTDRFMSKSLLLDSEIPLEI